MKRRKNSGFSLLEVIAAVVILAVVAAATVATVAPMRAKSEDKLADQEVATLNAMAQTYYLEVGSYPASVIPVGDRWLPCQHDTARAGASDQDSTELHLLAHHWRLRQEE